MSPIYNTQAQILGCTHNQAINYNAAATINDGSCIFTNANITLTHVIALDSNSLEISGIQIINNQLWSHNDGGNANALFKINNTTGDCSNSKTINASNIDWEDITQDSTHIYIGDFGNNVGNRQNLKIIKIPKDSLQFGLQPIANKIINFTYSDQQIFTSNNTTNFDCEAMLHFNNKLYVFTKNWGNHKTQLYQLDTDSTNATAQLIDSFDCKGLITGADIYQNTIVLLGYDTNGASFAWLLWDYQNNNFFKGHKRRIDFGLSGGQCEAITFVDSNTLLIANENFSIFKNRLARFDFSKYTNQNNITALLDAKTTDTFSIKNNILYMGKAANLVKIFNQQGQCIQTLDNKNTYTIDLNATIKTPGIYFVKANNSQSVFKIIIQ
jgi:hypothetical protein